MDIVGGGPAVSGYLRLWHILGDKKRGLKPIIPVSATAWWRGVKSGIYPQPVRIGLRTTVWRSADILALAQAHAGEPDTITPARNPSK